jgi:hypothetical protein
VTARQRRPHRRAASAPLELYAAPNRCWPGAACIGARIDQSDATMGSAGKRAPSAAALCLTGGRVLARLHRMCDIRSVAVNPAALKSSRAQLSYFIFYCLSFYYDQ